jgi:hypothetical protein
MRAALVVLAALAAGGCAGPALAPAASWKDVDQGELLLVGKVELDPPLHEKEQGFGGLQVMDVKNKVFLLLGEEPRKEEAEPSMADYAGRLEASLGKTFFVRRERGPFWVRDVFVILDANANRRVYFPGNLKVDARPGDKAVYVGTIRYKRDEFFNVLGASVSDDYEAAEGAFRKHFGSKVALRKALARAPAKKP